MTLRGDRESTPLCAAGKIVTMKLPVPPSGLSICAMLGSECVGSNLNRMIGAITLVPEILWNIIVAVFDGMRLVLMEGQMFFKEEFSKKTIIQLRWTLIIVIGYIFIFNHSGKSIHGAINVLLPIYALTNILLSFAPENWFRRQRFLTLIMLLDLCMTALTIYWVGPKDSEFYVTFFLILLMSAVTHKSLFVYSTFGFILVVYGVTSYLKSPQTFFSTPSLLQFPFIIILALFFRGVVVSYNRVYQEKELLKEDYRELEVLNSVALSIGQSKDLSRFLFRLSKLLSEMLGLERCTAILMDSKDSHCYMVSSDDLPKDESKVIRVEDFPNLKESLQAEDIVEQGNSPLPLSANSKYILKKIPLSFKGKKLGTLYLRANTLKDSLTRREEYFLEVLGRITSIAILDAERTMEKSMVFEQVIDL